jgi:hypothetical protein
MNWTNMYKQYSGQWVALAEDEETVIGSGDSAKQALDEAKSSGIENPVLTRVPDEDLAYIG